MMSKIADNNTNEENSMNTNTNDNKENTMNTNDNKETTMNNNTTNEENAMTNTTNEENTMNTTTNEKNTMNNNVKEKNKMKKSNSDADIVTANGDAFRIKGKGSLEVNPGYFAAKIVKKYGLVFFRANGWFEWTKDGWTPARRCIIQSRIRDLLKKKVSSFRMPSSSKSQAPTMSAFEQVNTGNINEILRLITIDCDRGDTLPQLDPDVIPLQNRILRWNAEKKDFDSAPYTQDDLIFSRLNAEYAPEADQTFFLGKLTEILPDAEDRRVVQEYMGAALFAENRTRKFTLFQGEGGCGKSLLVIPYMEMPARRPA